MGNLLEVIGRSSNKEIDMYIYIYRNTMNIHFSKYVYLPIFSYTYHVVKFIHIMQ